MKLIVFLALALASLACVAKAQPVTALALMDEPHSRQKRFTCDLLSKWNWNHTACAAHCLTLGKSGGYCSDKAVCICR